MTSPTTPSQTLETVHVCALKIPFKPEFLIAAQHLQVKNIAIGEIGRIIYGMPPLDLRAFFFNKCRTVWRAFLLTDNGLLVPQSGKHRFTGLWGGLYPV
jgi:hypothetical protein